MSDFTGGCSTTIIITKGGGGLFGSQAARLPMSEWHRLEKADLLAQLETGEHGLAQAQAGIRLTRYGPNELVERGAKSPLRIVWEQLTELMVVILIIAAVISALVGDYKDTVAILAIVLINVVLGFSQEYRAEKAMAALKQMAVPTVRVRRDGHVVEVSSRELVPGDLVIIEAGNVIPADGRLIESVNLQTQEAALTGESAPVDKHDRALPGAGLALGDRLNMVYMGTIATGGRGLFVVTETGMSTELGRVAEMIQSVEQEQTPLQRRLDQLGRGLAGAALVIVAIVFAMGLLRGEELPLMLMTAISLAVAAVPEGLPAVVTIALALGGQRMLKRQALIRKLPAVETLGSVTVICSDKTGTLTENRMTVTILDVAGHTLNLTNTLNYDRPIWIKPASHKADAYVTGVRSSELDTSLLLLSTGVSLCNDAILEPDEEKSEYFNLYGDPTEGALLIAAARVGLFKKSLERALPRLAEVPFTSERKRMTTFHELRADEAAAQPRLAPVVGALSSSRYLAFAKGAVDSLLSVSSRVWVNGEIEPLSDEWRRRIEEANDRLALDGMRVLGVAFRPMETLLEEERDLVFVGLVSMIDPPRQEVKGAVRVCKGAGIRPVMITGDHPLTARYIAQELGIAEDGKVLTGQDISAMPDEELEKVVETVPVYARVAPEHKLRIVQTLQRLGQIVAMTGDGVNDAPALKKADIGVAMGITGTDVSKEAADMVLLDDNFATIVAAVEEGRVIYDNIRKFIKYIVVSNFGEVLTMLLAPLLGMPLPLLPLQVLWVNLVTDGLPGLALTVEPAGEDTMRRPPHSPQESIFARGMGRDIVMIGILIGIVSLGVGFWFWREGRSSWQTAVFTTLALAQMWNVMALRSERASLFSIGLLSNKPLLGAVSLTVVLQMAVVYVPFLQKIFKTVPLSLSEMVTIVLLSSTVFWVVELEKRITRD